MFYNPVTVPAGVYPKQNSPLNALNVGSMHLIASAGLNEDLVYEITKAIFQNREAVVKRHPAGRSIQPGNVVRATGTPFHPGAVRFYREIGVWPENRSGSDGG